MTQAQISSLEAFWAQMVGQASRGGEQDYASAADLEGCFYCSAFVASNPDEKVQHFVGAYRGTVRLQLTALGL